MVLSNRLFAIGKVILTGIACFLLPAVRASAAGGAVWVEPGANYKTPASVRGLVNELIESPFDEVIVKVVDQGTSWYRSTVLPMPLGSAPGFDPLTALIEGLNHAEKPKRVTVWIEPLLVANQNETRTLDPTHVYNEHREWLSQGRDGRQTDSEGNYYLEPSLADVQAMLSLVVTELCRNYRIDGVYLDSVSDPAPDWGFHPDYVKQWQEANPDNTAPMSDSPEWLRMRAQTLSALIGRLAQAAADEGKAFSAGAIARGQAPTTAESFARSSVFLTQHQDWPTWLREGLVQRLVLKVFVVEGTSGQAFDDWVKFGLKAGQEANVPVQVGVSGAMNASVDVLAQMRRALTLGSPAVVISNFTTLTNDREQRSLFLRTIEKTVFDEGYRKRLERREGNRLNGRTEASGTAAGDEPKGESLAEAIAGGSEESGDVQSIAQVPDETDRSLPPPPTIEEGAGGKVIPLSSVDAEMAEAINILSGQARPEDLNRRAMATSRTARDSAGGQGGSVFGESASGAGQGGVYTRQDVLMQIVNDPAYVKSQPLFIPSTQAREYLRKMYPNVF